MATFTLLVLSALAPASMAAELAPHILAQVDERGGFRAIRAPFSVRIFDDGGIEALEMDKWIQIGQMSEPAVARFKRVTDVIIASTPLVVHDDTNPADAPEVEYSVRNKSGEVVLIEKRGSQNTHRLQGGVSSIVQVLDGLAALARISN
jgi:hypothetical protein